MSLLVRRTSCKQRMLNSVLVLLPHFIVVVVCMFLRFWWVFVLIRLYLLIGRLQPIPRVSIEKYIQFFSCLSYKFLWFSKEMTLVYFSSCLINLLLSRSQTSVYFHKTSACSIPLSTFFKMA